MKDKDKQNKRSNPTVWFLVFMIFFSSVMLLWLKSHAIGEWGQKLGIHSPNQQENMVESQLTSLEQTNPEPTVSNKASSMTNEKLETSDQTKEDNLKVLREETTTIVETTLSMDEANANLPDPITYSIFQYQNNEIENRFVNRAFEVLIQRLIDEHDYFSTVDYQLTVYPTLDDNIYNLGLKEHYADQSIDKGQYRFDYRGKKVTKY